MEAEEQRAALEAAQEDAKNLSALPFSAEQISLVGGRSSCTGHSTEEALKKRLFKSRVDDAPVQSRMQ